MGEQPEKLSTVNNKNTKKSIPVLVLKKFGSIFGKLNQKLERLIPFENKHSRKNNEWKHSWVTFFQKKFLKEK